MRVEATIGGALAGTSEWNVTASFQLNQAPGGIGALQAAANAAGVALAGSTAFRGGLCTDTSLGFLKLAYYANDVSPATIVVTAPVGGAGAVTPVHAPQVCVVASLRTDHAGRSFRGRQYWPYRGANVLTTGAVNASGATLVAATTNAFQSAIITALAAQGMGSVWGVWSKTLGLSTAIRSILVGGQCDTQRRRNRNENETFTAFAVSAPALAAGSENLDLAISSQIPYSKMVHGELPPEDETIPEFEKPLPIEIIPE